MKVCIAGGGRVGMYLAQSLLSHHHKVTIIEPQEALCRTLADTLDIPVICGDSLSFDTLRTADVASCDAFVAVTNTDETNLVACQIAKREFGVNRTVARASNPKNRDILHTLGVDTVVCGTDNLSHILEREIETDTIRQLLSLGGGTASLNEILLPEDFQFAGKEIKEIPIPGDAILVSITRDTEFIIPHGSTVLLPWDRLLCLTQDDTLHLLMDAWGGGIFHAALGTHCCFQSVNQRHGQYFFRASTPAPQHVVCAVAQWTDNSYALITLQRQQIPIVFQQHLALLCNFAGLSHMFRFSQSGFGSCHIAIFV